MVLISETVNRSFQMEMRVTAWSVGNLGCQLRLAHLLHQLSFCSVRCGRFLWLPQQMTIKQVASNHTGLLSHSSGQKPEIKVPTGPCSKCSRENPFLPPPASGGSWSPLACGPITPVSVSVFTRPPSFLCVCVSKSPSPSSCKDSRHWM